MKNSYLDLIEQTFPFPQEEFDLNPDNYLRFNDIDLYSLIQEYGTPLRLTYLPKINQQISKAKMLFQQAIEKHDYSGRYFYCYCTKSSHFKYVVEKALESDVFLETSSAFDMDIVKKLVQKNLLASNTKVICNGFKPRNYTNKIVQLINDGMRNVIPVLDNVDELDVYTHKIRNHYFDVGIRVATEEEPNFQFYTSRLGIRNADVISFYNEKIKPHEKIRLRMLHFFVDKGIRDTIYYWNEFKKCISLYCKLKKICPTLKALNIGGGLPIKNSLGFEYDYEYMISEIVLNIKMACDRAGVPYPDIYTEFGTYTVGESGAHIFSVLAQKEQNDAELWYMIDNSLMTTLPDTWGIDQRFLLLPINKWKNEYTRVNIGGITCDNSDYYNAEAHIAQLYLPSFAKNESEPLYIGFFNTGAYQESISGYGGIKHCLIPAPKHILIDKSSDGSIKHWLYKEEQQSEPMLHLLGY